MKKQFIRQSIIAMFVIGIAISQLSIAHELTDKSHGVKIEKIESTTGYPIDVHVEKITSGVIVRGKIKRKKHSKLKIRGKVDVDLIDANGKVIDHAYSRLIAPSVKASRNRFSHFTVKFKTSLTDNYSIRVAHAVNGSSHK